MIIEGRTLAGDLEIAADVAIVGSGASGAVVAKELSEAGLEVVVLEEGPHVPPEVYGSWRPTQTVRNMARLAGSQMAIGIGDAPSISLMSGRAVGGSSTMTGGVCFRIPSEVLRRWEHDLHLPGYGEAALEPAFEAVEEEIHVEEVPVGMRSRSTHLFAAGAAKRGIAVRPLRRNTQGCVGMGRCNFGCPRHAKLSVDLTYLKKAAAKGMRLYSDCLIEKVVEKDGRAAGVVGRFLDAERRPRGRVRVHAKTVVLCAGALHTPKVLARSGVGRRSGELGRHLTLHPAFRVAAYFDELVEGWKGAMQSAYSDALHAQNLTLVGVFVPPNLAAAGMPFVGPKYMQLVRQIPNMALFGGLVHDEGRGRLLHVPGREPVVVYRMSRQDKQAMVDGMRVLAQCFFEAGAKKILLPVWGMEPLDGPDDLSRLDMSIPARLFECMSFHPLGSARMGIDRRKACVSPSGETFDLPNLYVADGSLFPTSIGVNSQLPIMAVATKIAWGLREKLA